MGIRGHETEVFLLVPKQLMEAACFPITFADWQSE